MKYTLKYFRPYIPLILLVVCVLFGQAMCELALPGYMSDIINNGIVKGDMDYIRKTGIIMIVVAFGSMAFAVGAGALASRASAASSRDIRKSLFSKVTSFGDAEMDRFSTASLITRSTNDVQMVQQASVMILRMALFAPIMGIGALIKALRTSTGLTWTIALALGVILCIMLVVFFLVMPKFKKLQKLLDRLNLIIGERLSGLLVIRAFNSESVEEDRYDKTNKDLTKINTFTNRIMSFMFPAIMVVMNLVNVMIVWFGSKLIDTQDLMIGDMLAFLQYAMQIIMSFLVITMMFIMVPRAVVSGNRIGEVLAVEPSVKDRTDAGNMAGKSVNAGSPAGEIKFENVSFAYPDAGDETLSGIDFTARPGQTTAIIGCTGSGKSSLISLIPRFYDVTYGTITLDGIDIRNMSQSQLRSQIGFVPQKGLLFSGTIRSNLAFGKSSATEEEMLKAAETAQALPFIKALPEKLDTPVAQGGTSVSGGQKQRLSIARALIKKPPVLIFDDSFSALDFRTDAALRKSLKKNYAGSTKIIVAQRINTIMDADQILVMDEGRIVGAGTHRELLRSCPVYKEIAGSQLSEEELRKEEA
ncbi:MAG: ABC transporter ATP-binding protein [Eubacteriaceae bacterium]|nr:ABC transporter ATP-binding protein [Eubacteriaceae bacterium]